MNALAQHAWTGKGSVRWEQKKAAFIYAVSALHLALGPRRHCAFIRPVAASGCPTLLAIGLAWLGAVGAVDAHLLRLFLLRARAPGRDAVTSVDGEYLGREGMGGCRAQERPEQERGKGVPSHRLSYSAVSLAHKLRTGERGSRRE